MYLQSIQSVKHNAEKSVNRSILKKSRHIGFGIFIVRSSMCAAVRDHSVIAAEKMGNKRNVALRAVSLRIIKELAKKIKCLELKKTKW